MEVMANSVFILEIKSNEYDDIEDDDIALVSDNVGGNSNDKRIK